MYRYTWGWFCADDLSVDNIDGRYIMVRGENQVYKTSIRTFDEFGDFIEEVLNRNGEHDDDPITGVEHLENIYNIMIGKQ